MRVHLLFNEKEWKIYFESSQSHRNSMKSKILGQTSMPFFFHYYISLVFPGSGRNTHQNLGDDLSSNIIIGATPSHWNNDGRGNSNKYVCTNI